DGARGVTPCEVLDTGLELVLPWEEGHLRQVDAAATLGGLSSAPALQRFDVPGEVTREVVRHEDGRPIGRLTRTRVPVRGNLVVRAEPVEAERPLWRVTVRVENVTPLRAAPQMRAEAVRSACVSTHLLLHADGGGFL